MQYCVVCLDKYNYVLENLFLVNICTMLYPIVELGAVLKS